MSVDILLAFVLASTILSLAPGPDNIFVLTQSALHGRRAGMLVTLGLCTGLVVHSAAAALGVAAIFMASATAFTMVKLAGAGYLLYLAWGAFRAAAGGLDADAMPRLGNAALYRRGIIMNLSNPKVAVFFLAFLPQFARPEAGSLSMQLMLLGLIFILVALVVFLFIACAAGLIAGLLTRSTRAQIVMNRVAGLVFVGLALQLAVTDR